MNALRHDWTTKEVTDWYEQPFFNLIFVAQQTHRAYFNTNEMQLCTLLSVKTGACPEDCAYCPQSAHYETALQKEKLMNVTDVVEQAKLAKQQGATRFCMGAAWRQPSQKDFSHILAMVKAVKAEGLETCVTLGMLTKEQASALKVAGLDYYNHNLDTSPDYYAEIITTRTYQDRLDTLSHVREAGLNTCCGGIVGMGESRADRIQFLLQLANLPEHPQSVPVNRLISIPGTPLATVKDIENFEFIRTIAVARILMPRSRIRLSAGRETMSEELQAWCFFAGANSIFYGDKLLTAKNPDADADRVLLAKLGMEVAA